MGINYYDSDVIGNGATAIVYRGFFDVPEKKAAIKRVFVQYYDVFENELKIWSSVDDNVNIIRCFKYLKWEEPTGINLYFAMELANTSLQNFVEQNPQDYVSIKNYLRDACKGLKWLHGKRVIHRDIKPANIMIFDNGIAKLGDFGISKKISSITEGTNSMGRGTGDYLAPEVIEAIDTKQAFVNTTSLDIFSMGLTIHNSLAQGNHIFGSVFRRLLNITSGRMDWSNLVGGDMGVRAKSLVSAMIKYEGKDRPNIEAVLNHPFFWNYKKDLRFVMSLAKSFSDKNIPEIKQINSKYSDEMSKTMMDGDWRQYIEDASLELFTANHKRKYKTSRIMELVALIRDKNEHYLELNTLLLMDDFFGENGEFSDEKYIKFFTSKVPHLIIFLYCTMQSIKVKGRFKYDYYTDDRKNFTMLT